MKKLIAKFIFGINTFEQNEDFSVDTRIIEEKIYFANLESSRVCPKYGLNKPVWTNN